MQPTAALPLQTRIHTIVPPHLHGIITAHAVLIHHQAELQHLYPLPLLAQHPLSGFRPQINQYGQARYGIHANYRIYRLAQAIVEVVPVPDQSRLEMTITGRRIPQRRDCSTSLFTRCIVSLFQSKRKKTIQTRFPILVNQMIATRSRNRSRAIVATRTMKRRV